MYINLRLALNGGYNLCRNLDPSNPPAEYSLQHDMFLIFEVILILDMDFIFEIVLIAKLRLQLQLQFEWSLR